MRTRDEISRVEPQLLPTSQAERSFHLQSLFHQAQILGVRIDSKPLTQNEISGFNVSAIAVLLKNQTSDKLENIAQEFQKSENPENKKIGEVIHTFTHAEISQAENKTIISIKLPENGLVGTETYRELLEKFYPDGAQENEKYKFENLDDKEISRALSHGQDESIENLRDDINSNVYQKEVSPSVFEIESSLLDKLDKIVHFQAEARNALRENTSILNKYNARANAKMPKTQMLSPSVQKEIVTIALGAKQSNLAPNKINDQFLQAVQMEITISDFHKFAANEKFLGEAKFNIREEFAGISQDLKVLEESKLNSPKSLETGELKQSISGKIANEKLIENKPFTLQIFEKELEKTEKQLLAVNLKDKLATNSELEQEKIFNTETVFSTQELKEIKEKAFEKVKEKLEPKELGADHLKVSAEASRQAFTTYKQLVQASNLLQTGGDKSKIMEAFSKLDRDAASLNKIRKDYNRNEKTELLREGIKTDLVDWFKKNINTKQNISEGHLSKLLMENFKQSDFKQFVKDQEQIGILSRQIAVKIESKQISATKDKGIPADSREVIGQGNNLYLNSEIQVKANHLINEKGKNEPTFSR